MTENYYFCDKLCIAFAALDNKSRQPSVCMQIDPFPGLQIYVCGRCSAKPTDKRAIRLNELDSALSLVVRGVYCPHRGGPLDHDPAALQSLLVYQIRCRLKFMQSVTPRARRPFLLPRTIGGSPAITVANRARIVSCWISKIAVRNNVETQLAVRPYDGKSSTRRRDVW